MFKYFLNRVLFMGLIMLFVTSITFFIVRLLPGDPVFLLVGDHPTEEQIEKAKNELGWMPKYQNLEEIINHAYKWHTKKRKNINL